MIRIGAGMSGLAWTLALGACASSTAPFEVQVYPPGLAQKVITEATVERTATALRIHNGSQMDLGPGRMWVNQEFSHPVGLIEAGGDVQLDLSQFRNEFGERFRAGGFWATEKPKRLALVQIKPDGNGGSLQGLVVVRDEPR